MNRLFSLVMAVSFMALSACADSANEKGEKPTVASVAWQTGLDTETFWLSYANAKGGLTWGQSRSYPDFNQVKEGDTFMVELDQGLCLMEFFHNRWRRANDVRRWDDSVNEYGGCPFVFD